MAFHFHTHKHDWHLELAGWYTLMEQSVSFIFSTVSQSNTPYFSICALTASYVMNVIACPGIIRISLGVIPFHNAGVPSSLAMTMQDCKRLLYCIVYDDDRVSREFEVLIQSVQRHSRNWSWNAELWVGEWFLHYVHLFRLIKHC